MEVMESRQKAQRTIAWPTSSSRGMLSLCVSIPRRLRDGGHELDVRGAQRAAVVGAKRQRADRLPVFAVDEHDLRMVFAEGALAPLLQRHQHDEEPLPLLCGAVLVVSTVGRGDGLE